MKHHPKSDSEVTMIGFTGTLFCALAGFLLFGGEIFNSGHPGFQFISYGILGGAIFTLVALRRYKTLLLTTAALFVLNLILAVYNNPLPMTVHILFFAGVAAVVAGYSGFIHVQLKRIGVLRPLILGGLMLLLYLLLTITLNQLYTVNQYPVSLRTNLPLGFLVGLGLGAGWQMAERIQELNQGKRKR